MGWSEEISLDVDMVSAVCRLCHIVLVEAKSNSFADLGLAADRAATYNPIAIGNSYGGSESASETTTGDGHYNHPGIAVVASSVVCVASHSSTVTLGSPGSPASW